MCPALFREASDAPPRDDHPFGEQQRPLGKEISSVAAQLAAGRNHAMAGDGGIARLAHDVADRSVRARAARECCDISVGRDPPVRDAPHHVADPRTEISFCPRNGRHHDRIMAFPPVFPGMRIDNRSYP